MKLPEIGKDNLKNDLFANSLIHIPFDSFQKFEASAFQSNAIIIISFAMDFPTQTTAKERKEIENQWIKNLPNLKKTQHLIIRHKVHQDYFEAICQMDNLKSLTIHSSSIEDINSISKLRNLESLHIDSFSKLENISALTSLKALKTLSIENSFNISNYEIIGDMHWLLGLSLEGNTFASKNLIIQSLKPFSALKNLSHLQLSTTSIKDKSFEELLKLTKLTRLDASWRMNAAVRNKILTELPKLNSGFFVAYDFDKKQFKEGIEWWIKK